MSDSQNWSMDDWAAFHGAVQATTISVAQSLLDTWVCRHCSHRTPVISEFCDGCGIEDCNQGSGEEMARDKQLRLSGQRGMTGVWAHGEAQNMARGLIHDRHPDRRDD